MTPDTMTLPELGSAPGWPLVLYFHHVTTAVHHYTALSPEAFRRGLASVLDLVGPAVEPATVGPAFVPPEEPGVLLTFDDGYRDTLVAAAIMAEFDVRAVVFCVTDRLTEAGTLDPAVRAGLPRREDYLTWAELAELTAAGHVGSAHTRTHPKLPELPVRLARAEVTGSLAAVAAGTGRPPGAFAYPYGLVPSVPMLPAGVLGFGTTKTAPAPWPVGDDSGHPAIRRTYLPTGAEESWPRICRGWRRQWYGSR